jgi:hypothetical protein
VELEAAPVTAEAVPGGHLVQAVAPGGEKVPEGQVKHAALVTEPVAELLVPWGQGTQALALMLPRLLLYLPASHSVASPLLHQLPLGHLSQARAPWPL